MCNPCSSNDLSAQYLVSADIADNMEVVLRRNNSVSWSWGWGERWQIKWETHFSSYRRELSFSRLEMQQEALTL